MATKRERDAMLHSTSPSRQVIARLGEHEAAQFLTRHGCIEIDRNWRSGRFGEIDLIMRSPTGEVVFVEVKTRKKAPEPEPGFANIGFEAITWSKRRKILIAARTFLQRKRISRGYRCDAVLVTFTGTRQIENDAYELQGVDVLHIPSAFDNV